MTTDKLANSPYLVRFPWDWPAVAWDFARVLAAHWEREDVALELESSGTEAEAVWALQDTLARYPSEPGHIPPPEALEDLDPQYARLLEAIAAFLRGNHTWARMQGLGDLEPVPADDEATNWERVAHEYGRACDLYPERSLCLTLGVAEIYLLELRRYDRARSMYASTLAKSLQAGLFGSGLFFGHCVKLASMFLVRAGLHPIDADMAEYSIAG